MIIEDLKKRLNKPVLLSLKNGREKSGVIKSVDEESDPPAILLAEPSGELRSIAIFLIGLVEDIVAATAEQKMNEPDNVQPDDTHLPPSLPSTAKTEASPSLPNHSIKEHDKTPTPVVYQYVTRIEITFDAEIKTAQLQITEPDFSTTPADIQRLNFGNASEEPRDWTFIKNKYENGRPQGRLTPRSDDLREIINRCRKLTEHPILYESPVFHAYLGYFYYLNDAKQDSIQSLQKAAKLSDHAQDWNNLAAVALEIGEKELACFALARVFIHESLTNEFYDKTWYKFSELVLKFSYFTSFNRVGRPDSGRVVLKEEHKRIFDTICYFLIKRKEVDIAESLIGKALETEDYYDLIQEGLTALPKETAPGFQNFITNFERLTIKYVPPAVPKPAYIAHNKPSFGESDKFMDFHRKALRAAHLKEFKSAEYLYRQAIEHNVNKQNAVRDLAMMLNQLKRPAEAVELLETYTDGSDADKQILYNLYYKLQRYDNAVRVKEDVYANYNKAVNSKKTNDTIAKIRSKKITMLSEIARAYFGLHEYQKSLESYQRVLAFSPEDYTIKRNIAICYYKSGNIDQAREQLEKIGIEEGDKKSLELLESINNLVNNASARDDSVELIIAHIMSQRATALDQFALFYLERCKYSGVPPERTENDRYVAADRKDLEYDIKKLENAATALGTERPGDRSEFFLSASKIIYDYDSQSTDPNFYKFLCKSFTSKADSAVYGKKTPDTIKTFYLESLKIYDSFTEDLKEKEFRELKFDEQDAVNAVVRYMYSQLGLAEIPLEAQYLTKDIDKEVTLSKQIKQIKDSCVRVFEKNFATYQNYNNVLDAINLLIARSPQYGGKRLLRIIYENAKWKKIAAEYLHTKLPVISINETATFEEFAKGWQVAVEELLDRENEIVFQVNTLRQFSLSPAWLKDAGQRISILLSKGLSFNLDTDYLKKLGDIIDNCISYIDSKTFDDRIGRYSDIDNKCRRLLEEIEDNPTKLSIEDIYFVVHTISQRMQDNIDRFYNESMPDLTFSSAVNPCIVKENKTVDIQIKLENNGDGHAEQLILNIKEDPVFFHLTDRTPISHGTIRGNAQGTIIANLAPTQQSLDDKAFSVIVSCSYKTRRGEEKHEESEPISIQLGSIEDFIKIDPNPYAQYASADVVNDENMFKGRKQFINEAYEVICNNYKSFAIFGQKRAGKSSILYHLGEKLKKEDHLLVADVGNIGRLIDPQSKVPLLYQLLFIILKSVKAAMSEHKIYSAIDLDIPISREFYGDVTPLDNFYDILDGLKKRMNQLIPNGQARLVILFDEFTYIYELMVSKEIKNKLGMEFLRNWKALLEKKLFNVVVVAQDFFEKFVALDPNSFQNVEPKRVSYLEHDYAKELINDPILIDKKKSRYAGNAIKHIIELTAASPYYIQIFCNQLVQHVNNEKVITITEANVDNVKNELLKGNNKLGKLLHFDNLFSDGDPSDGAISKEDSEKVLREIARLTKNQLYCNKKQIECITEKPIQVILDRLKDREVIDQNTDGYYRIKVGIFKEWLIENPE